jgi:hypothetical protein
LPETVSQRQQNYGNRGAKKPGLRTVRVGDRVDYGYWDGRCPKGRVLEARLAFYNPTLEGSMANKEQLEVLKQGVRAWNEWRIKNNPVIDLSGANLSGMDLSSLDVFTHLDVHHGTLGRPAGQVVSPTDVTRSAALPCSQTARRCMRT